MGFFYDQTDGIAMGSPLAPVLANLFMGHHEKIWLENHQGPEVIFHRRYVDDTSCLFNNKHGALLFFEYINSQYRNSKFTMEKEENHQLPFLDVLIDDGQSEFPVTSVFRKKTYTGLLTNFFSFTPSSYKLGLIRPLVDRAFKINNTWKGFNKEINQLTSILMKKCFPCYIIQRVVNNYLCKFSTTIIYRGMGKP